jgi:signal peptidase I
MKYLIITGLIFFFVSCNLREVNYSDEEIFEMKHKIILNGDEQAFSDYYTYVGKKDSLLYIEILPYSLSIIENDNSLSQIVFFENFLKVKFRGKYNPDDLSKLAKPEQDLLIYYLEKGSKNGSEWCVDILSNYYRKGIYYKKDVKKADSIYMATYGQPYPNITK